MDPKVFSALERAFQLARSGKMAAVGDLEKQLEREGLRPESRAWRTLAEGAIEKANPRGQGAKGRPESRPNLERRRRTSHSVSARFAAPAGK